jgi:hypothetical protein
VLVSRPDSHVAAPAGLGGREFDPVGMHGEVAIPRLGVKAASGALVYRAGLARR